MSNQPDLTKFRGAIFWDTAIENIDFTAHRGYVINRISSEATRSRYWR